MESEYNTISIYGEKSENPIARQHLVHFLSEYATDPFAFLAYYGLGEFDAAIAAAPKGETSIGVLYYAAGHKKLAGLLARTIPNLDKPKGKLGALYEYEPQDNDQSCRIDDRHPKCYFYQRYAVSGGRLSAFLYRAAATDQAKIRRALEANPDQLRQVIAYMDRAVETSRGLPHEDDAHYYLGVIYRYLGRKSDALSHFEAALRRQTDVVHGDYAYAALRQVVQMMLEVSGDDRLAMVSNSKVFSVEPTLWYIMARDTYRRHAYQQTIKIAEAGLEKIGVEVWRLPVTTDTSRIDDELKRSARKHSGWRMDINLREIVYLLNASHEMLRFITTLRDNPSSVQPQQVRSLVLKYSLLTTTENEEEKLASGKLGQHRDLRQALYLADAALNSLRRTNSAQVDALREWLHYRKVRILVQFEPKTVETAVKAFEEEYPQSKLLDDAYVELLYTQAFVLRANTSSVDATFRFIAERFPKQNAVDNAYNWYAIYLHCMKDYSGARNVNLDIIRKFPITRHAIYATERLASRDGRCQMWHE